MKRHVLLIGLPGAGKTTVGGMVARDLGAEFIDLDEIIEREQGTSVRDIFAARGEDAFRSIERATAEKIMSGPAVVFAPGGGWAAQPGALETARERCFIVYLRTTPGVAAKRVGDGSSRPLLAGTDPGGRMRELFAVREEFYLRAEATVDTDEGGPRRVSREIAKPARSMAGW